MMPEERKHGDRKPRTHSLNLKEDKAANGNLDKLYREPEPILKAKLPPVCPYYLNLPNNITWSTYFIQTITDLYYTRQVKILNR